MVKKRRIGTSNVYMRVFGIASSSGQDAQVVPSMQLHVGGKPLVLTGLMVYSPRSSSLVNCAGILGSDIAQFGTIRIDATNGLLSVGD